MGHGAQVEKPCIRSLLFHTHLYGSNTAMKWCSCNAVWLFPRTKRFVLFDFSTKLSDLQSRLVSQSSDDKQAALRELEAQKNDEISALKTGWEDQIRNLSAQVCSVLSINDFIYLVAQFKLVFWWGLFFSWGNKFVLNRTDGTQHVIT